MNKLKHRQPAKEKWGLLTCMRRLGRRRWSMPVEAKGEARCCNPADWSHRAMTASLPASLPPLPPAPAWSYKAVVAAAAAALLCCIWPPMWRCDRLWGANFQDLSNNRFTHKNPPSKFIFLNRNTISNPGQGALIKTVIWNYIYQTKKKKNSRNKRGTHKEGKIRIQSGTWKVITGKCDSNPRNLQLNETRFSTRSFKTCTKLTKIE